MHIGKTLFSQIIDFLPWKTFHRLVARYEGDYRYTSEDNVNPNQLNLFDY